MLSGIVLVKNEEKNIVDCLESIDFCDEIVVVDDYSEDRTVDLIKQLKNPKITIVQRKLDGDFAAQRNFALSKAKGDWVFFVDADERVSPELKKEILQVVQSESIDGYFLKRKDVMWGKALQYGETADVKLLRLARKGKATWKGKVHERWEVKGKTALLLHPLDHFPHVSLHNFIQEIDTYTTLRAKELYDQGVRTNWFFIIAYPKAKFILNYFFKQGFRDGTAGFMLAMMMSLHSFLVRGKLWLLWNEKSIKK